MYFTNFPNKSNSALIHRYYYHGFHWHVIKVEPKWSAPLSSGVCFNYYKEQWLPFIEPLLCARAFHTLPHSMLTIIP